jgi:hypothetical protein
MVRRRRIELLSSASQTGVLSVELTTHWIGFRDLHPGPEGNGPKCMLSLPYPLVPRSGNDPLTTGLQPVALPSELSRRLVPPPGVEPGPPECKTGTLPLRHGGILLDWLYRVQSFVQSSCVDRSDVNTVKKILTVNASDYDLADPLVEIRKLNTAISADWNV